MDFKTFVLLNEITSIVKGPFQLFHGTDSGENNATLQAFKQSGARPIGGGWGQGSGFYAWTDLKMAKSHALNRKQGKFSSNTEAVGQPMVVIVELPQINFDHWDLDIEFNANKIAGYAFKKDKNLNKLGQIGLSDKSKNYLQADSESENDFNKNLNFSSIRSFPSNPRKTVVFKTLAGTNRAVGSSGESQADTGIAQQMAPFYYAHQDANPERHKKLEAWFFLKSLKENKPIALKYTGSQPLPVKDILIHDGQNWINA